ncbi:MAG: nonstructural protein S [Mercurialis orthotospovirus 1]|nr:MAG: nonstructural protein S [Mercurialis orthotospovirus 1]
MSIVKAGASRFFTHYGTSCDSRSSNDCYKVINSAGNSFLNVFMHSSIRIKTAFSIGEVGRNEDIKHREAETLDTHHVYDIFKSFGLDISFCNHFLNITVNKPNYKNYDTKFNMHYQIFKPSESEMNSLGNMTEEKFYEVSNAKKSEMYPDEWFVETAKRNNFFIAGISEIIMSLGYSVMGRTTSYWRENTGQGQILSVKQKSMSDPSVPTNRLLSVSTVKAIQLGSELANSPDSILVAMQSLNTDLKSQYRVSFPGILEEEAIARTFLLNQNGVGQYICIYARTVVDRSNEVTTLIIKVVTQKKLGQFHTAKLPEAHSNCRKIIGASFGVTNIVQGDPNYNKIIAQELLMVHTQFALKISKALFKPVIVYKIYDKELKMEKIDIDGRTFNYNVDNSGNVYFLSSTLNILPSSLSVLIYLNQVSPPCWREDKMLEHFTVTSL